MQNSTILERHNYRRQFYNSLIFWAIGNTFTATALVIYLMNLIGFYSGTFISLIFAGNFVASVFRMALPSLLKSIKSRKTICINGYIYHIVALAVMFLAAIYLPEEDNLTAFIIIVLWITACIFENIAYLAYVSWNQALFPRKTIGRFFSRREKWRLLGEVIGIIIFVLVFKLGPFLFPGDVFPKSINFGLHAGFGFAGLFFIGKTIYILHKIPDVHFQMESLSHNNLSTVFRRLSRPFFCPKFWPILVYSGLFSFFMQLEQVTQNRFICYLTSTSMFIILVPQVQKLIIKAGQLACAPWVGYWIDRIGSLSVMAISQFLSAFAMLFYIYVKPGYCWFLVLAGFIWISYVGLNVALIKMQLEYSTDHDETPWFAAYSLIGGISGVIGVLLGGQLYDFYQTIPNFYQVVFTYSFWIRIALTLPLIVALIVYKFSKNTSKIQENAD
ncbi:MAG: MFS transporter [Planctomycetia bacterium]|nr:MFS transporter [Planctomycetia bacterium]